MKLNPEKQAASWNHVFPVGQRVLYWTGIIDGPGIEGVTRTPAEVLGGTAVIWIEGVRGCVALSHVEVPPRFGVWQGTPSFKVPEEWLS